ncbi:sodium:proton antiporter [Alteribacter natronophilus]|uniref:sodium:proton antiporter n=1 Tax=Alteribacter natronophilus TaxID=2583810 RepID=UPI001FE794F3|nr:sodium:proton antiporter [Alteribacter natronophilus]
MGTRILWMAASICGAFFLYRTRYRIINAFLKRPWLRRLAVSSVMRIPAVRTRMLSQVIR